MKLKEFWKSKKGIAIHCDTEEKAEKLCKAFDQMGQKWNTGCSYLENDLWHYYETESCYTNRNIYSSKSFYEGFDYRIIPFEEIEDFQTNEIHLTKKGKEVHAVHKIDGKVVNRTKAVCSKEDEFNFGTGARIAFNRLQVNKDFAEDCKIEKKVDCSKFPVDTKIFVSRDDESAMEANRKLAAMCKVQQEIIAELIREDS